MSNQSSLLAKLNALLVHTDLQVSDEQKQKLVSFVLLLHKWNKAYNLSSVREPEDMLVKHILDSIVVSPYLNAKRIADVGTGPGLPGIPLAIMAPDKSFTLIDSLGKRVRFIKQALYELNISNVEAIQSRVEAVTPSEGFDCIVSRAFASLADMLTWCEHLASPTTRFLALKGQIHEDEIAQIPAHFSVAQCIPLLIPSLEGERHLIEVVKRQG